jgi:hypothetical protein
MGWTEICPETLTFFLKVNAGGTYTDIVEFAVDHYSSLCEGKPTVPFFMIMADLFRLKIRWPEALSVFFCVTFYNFYNVLCG